MAGSDKPAWYCDPASRSYILAGYLPWLAVLNLAWEAAHVRLYTLWNEAASGYIAFSVVHCTLGDAAIGAVALATALMLTRSRVLASWHWRGIAPIVVLIGAGYTALSEWMNLSLDNWRYAESMPVVHAFGAELGLSPLAQWLVIPPLALWFGRRLALRGA